MSNYIRQIQADLKAAGFYTGEIDGIAGKLTVDAVNSALARGKCDKDTAAGVQAQNATSPALDNKANIPAPKNAKYTLSAKSLVMLNGVDERLQRVVKLAIEKTHQDFTVTEGLRTKERQAELVRKGASQTMNSKHLLGHAVDLAPIVDGKVSWDWNYFYPIADAMRAAAKELNVRIRWGGAWVELNNTTAKTDEIVAAYARKQKSEGKKAFLDGPHFELML